MQNPTVVFTAAKHVVVEDRPIPETPPDAVLIRTHVSLISIGTELTILAGEFPPDGVWARMARYPTLPGYDNIGTIVDVGANVDKALIGQRVASYGKHAALNTTPVDCVYPIPAAVTDEHAAFFTISEIVMNGIRRSGLVWGESVAVFGLGLLGQFAVRIARLAGACPVFAVDIADERLSRLPDDPNVIPINSQQDNPADIVSARSNGRMADLAIELTGNGALIPKQLEVVREQGRLLVLSSPRNKTTFDFNDLCNYPSYTIIGAHNKSHPNQEGPHTPWTRRRHAEVFFDGVADGRLDLSPLISHREPFANAPDIYQRLLADRSNAMGIVLDWSDAPQSS